MAGESGTGSGGIPGGGVGGAAADEGGAATMTGGIPGAGGAATNEGGTTTTAGGATTIDEGGAGGYDGAAGDGGQEPDLVIGAASGWKLQGVVNDQLGTVLEQSLAVDLRGNGDAVLVWSETNVDGETNIVASHHSAGLWSKPQVIDGLPGNAAEPHVTMDGHGNATAIWEQKDDKNRFGIFYARYVAQTAKWTTASPHQMGPAPYNATHPRVAADAAGNVLAAWNAEYGTNNVVAGTRVVSSYYKEAAQTSGWTIPEPLSSPGVPQVCGRPRVALSAQGRGFVVWNDSDGVEPDRRRVYAARYLPDAGFAATRALNEIEPHEEPAQIEDVPEVVMDDGGDALVTWRQVGVSGSVGVALSWYFAKVGQWTAQPSICEGRPTIGAPALALNRSGDFAVSYWDAQLGKRQLVVTHGKMTAQGGFEWAPAEALLESSTVGGDPALAVDQTGTALLAWTQALKIADNLIVGRSSPAGVRSFGTLQLNLNYGTAYPALAAFPGTDLALLTYFEAYDIHSATTEVE